MKIYMIHIVFPYSGKDPEVQTPIFFDKAKAVECARELSSEIDPDEERVTLQELAPDYEMGHFRTVRMLDF